MTTPPFSRTVCACPPCVAHCYTKPGFLVPDDVANLADLLLADGRITQADDVLQFLKASSGAVVAYQGQLFRIGSITPRMQDGRCVFLSPEERCTVHAVAPFGCSMFDDHMDRPEGDRRLQWSLRQIATDPSYTELRQWLTERGEP